MLFKSDIKHELAENLFVSNKFSSSSLRFLSSSNDILCSYTELIVLLFSSQCSSTIKFTLQSNLSSISLKIGYSRICACASFVYVFCFDQLYLYKMKYMSSSV